MDNEFSEDEDERSESYGVGECESGFSILEKEFKTVLSKLQENEELAEFSDAYSRLFEAYYESYQSSQEKTLENQVLSGELEEVEDKLQHCKLNVADFIEKTENLENDLENAKKLTDDAHAREQQAQEIIENMRNQILKLNNELELKSRLAGEDDDSAAMSKTQEGFEREKQRLIDEIQTLKQKLTNALSYSEELEHKNSAADLKATELNLMIEQQASELTKKQRQIEKLEGDINIMVGEKEQDQITIAERAEELDLCRKQISALEVQLRDQKVATEKATKHGEMVQVKLEKCHMENEMSNLELTELKEKHTDLVKNYRLRNDECNSLRNDMSKLNKMKENLEKKIAGLERLKYSLESERDKLNTNISMMEREVIVSKRQADTDKRTIDGLTKEKEILSKNIMRVQSTVDGHMKLIKIQEQTKRKLEAEILNLTSEINQQKKMYMKLDKEKNKAMSEALDLTQQVEDAVDENAIKQRHIFDLKKTIAELETKLRQQQNLFEQIRADRNSLQKQVQEITNEITELKSKLKISVHQSQQFKEDIASKEALLIKEENILRKLNKEKENLKVEVQSGLNTIGKLKFDLEETTRSEKSLIKSIGELEKTIKMKDKLHEQIVNDRDVIGAQLVRRNDQLGLLSEKIDILETTLDRGKSQYNQRIDDIKLLKLEIKRLRQEKNYLSKSIANMSDLKTEVFTLERELAQERLKTRALEEELQHPMNIHRWRKLEGSDPHIVDLLKKIQILQKRLLNQTSESLEREKQLKETEKLYLSLRQMLSRQPGPEMKNELIKTQKALASRGTKMKCMVAELNMYETQAMEFKMDIDKISKELRDTKKKYLKQKKACQSQSHLISDVKLPAIKQENVGEQPSKFTGGGYKMS